MTDGDSRHSIEVAVFALIERGLAELPAPASKAQILQLTHLVLLVSEWALRINLTGHRDPIEMAGRLVLDAAALSACLPELDSASRLADLGSGVGFPGLPIAILRPDLEVVLVESRSKRHHLQREVRRQLSLSRVLPILGRSDEVEILKADVVVAQAMAQPERALELMQPWARPGGWVVVPASEGAASPRAPRRIERLSLREYRVPQSDRRRCLWVGQTSPASGD